jgi:UDP-glucose 4-epimerase
MDIHNNVSVLVTGGRGFIGRAVVKLLRGAGYRVSSLDQSGPAISPAEEGLREVVCDISDIDQLQRVFGAERFAGIIHLAAILPTVAQSEPLRATQVNVVGSLHLLELARQFGVARIVFGSSVSVYGTCPDVQVVSELDRAAPEDVYGAAKLYVELAGKTYRGSDLDFVSLRIARVVGPGAQSATSAWRSEIFELLGAEQAAEITISYGGSEKILLVHVDEVARMLVTLLQAPRPEQAVYNAPCESVVVEDLKRAVEGLNSNVRVRLGGAGVVGNPRLLDCRRFADEFEFRATPIFERLKLGRLHR